MKDPFNIIKNTKSEKIYLILFDPYNKNTCIQEFRWTQKFKKNSIGEKFPIIWYPFNYVKGYIKLPANRIPDKDYICYELTREKAQKILSEKLSK